MKELPEGMAGKQYSGKSDFRLSAPDCMSDWRLAALKEGKSLNNYVAEVLERRLAR